MAWRGGPCGSKNCEHGVSQLVCAGGVMKTNCICENVECVKKLTGVGGRGSFSKLRNLKLT